MYNNQQNTNAQKVNWNKVIVALVASAIGPAVMYAVIILNSVFLTSTPWSDKFGTIVFFGTIAFIVGCAHSLILGLPAFLVGLYFKAIRWWSTLLVGFVIGSAPYAISLWNSHLSSIRFSDYVYDISGVGLFGVSGGIVFWFLWRYWASPS